MWRRLNKLAQTVVYAMGVRILMYHSIGDNSEDPHAISTSEFARQMDELGRHRDCVVDLPSAIHMLKRGQDLISKIVLTFDDAYEDFLLNAAPILMQFKFPAT